MEATESLRPGQSSVNQVCTVAMRRRAQRAERALPKTRRRGDQRGGNKGSGGSQVESRREEEARLGGDELGNSVASNPCPPPLPPSPGTIFLASPYLTLTAAFLNSVQTTIRLASWLCRSTFHCSGTALHLGLRCLLSHPQLGGRGLRLWREGKVRI